MIPRMPEPELMDLAHEADAYAIADFSDVNRAFVERLMHLAGNVDRAVALDLGTGPADIPVRAARERPEWRIVAADASFPMLRHARAAVRAAALDETVFPVMADAKRLPFPTGGFDVVFSNSILHHIDDTAGFWAETSRVCAGGARVLLRDLARPTSQEAARGIVEKYAGNESDLLKEEYFRSLLAAYTPSEVRGQLDKAGLWFLEVEMVTDRHLDVFGRIPE